MGLRNLVALSALLEAALAGPTVYLAGDSTMAKGGDGAGTNTDGWGQYLGYSLDIPVVNNAIAGRSARSFWEEGRFQSIANNVVSGDFVVIEFGHNDGGSLTPTDNGRSDCPGEAAQTCTSTYNGKTDTVYTFNHYLEEASQLYSAKGAHVIISSQTPDNPWETGTFNGAASRFVQYANDTAATLGTSVASYVNHFGYVSARFKSLGATVVDGYYPVDHTHTSTAGANTVSQAFVKGVVCGGSYLSAHVKNATSTIPGSCL
ncbi:carbohydrate esterase family 12 protein [Viridothelium virens]|uniref:Carbohydrate esterase family 12 protein n=1 Tax=Viridothelium virens TaxID=1048519 RepID=A0A6A6HFB3_VIRVR|nr:carbohydrate esterase family 12 protein [Viridothelium virens]